MAEGAEAIVWTAGAASANCEAGTEGAAGGAASPEGGGAEAGMPDEGIVGVWMRMPISWGGIAAASG